MVFLHEAYQPWEEAVEAADLGYEITRSRTEELIFGTLVLTRPGAEVRSFGFAAGQRRGVEVRQMVGDREVAVLGIHPLAPTGPGRTELRDGQLDWAAEWAESQTRSDGGHRRLQRHPLVARLPRAAAAWRSDRVDARVRSPAQLPGGGAPAQGSDRQPAPQH